MNTFYSDLNNQKRFKDIYEMANAAYLSTGEEHELRTRAKAAMSLKRYRKASMDFLELIRIRNPEYKSDSEFINAGIAYWNLGCYKKAVSIWEKGLDKSVRYSSNTVNIPALLFFAASYLKDKHLLKLATIYLKNRWENNNPIAGYLLGDLSMGHLLEIFSEQRVFRLRNLCKAHFYIAVRLQSEDHHEGFVRYLHECISIEGSHSEFEYHLAIAELEKIHNLSRKLLS